MKRNRCERLHSMRRKLSLWVGLEITSSLTATSDFQQWLCSYQVATLLPKNLCSLWLRWSYIQLIFEHIERRNNCSAEFLRKRVWRRRRGEWMTKLGLSDVFVQSWDKLFCPPPPKRPLCNFSFRSLTSSAAFQGFSDTWLLFHTLTKSWKINVQLIFATYITWYFVLHMSRLMLIHQMPLFSLQSFTLTFGDIAVEDF